MGGGAGSVEVLVSVPCVILEDDHLLAVNKPAGMNTHAPGPFAGEGIYDWLRHREPRWARLAIIHRLDKETSGLLLFSKTELANRSLTDQFTRGIVKKSYLLLTDRPVRRKETTVTSALVRAGEKYRMRPDHAGGERAETRFRLARRLAGGTLVRVEPVTGRTHQIRVHAAACGFPILGDRLYGGTPHQRVCLHSEELTLKHPATGNTMTLIAPADFFADARLALRSALIDWEETNACRIIHGEPDAWPGWYVDRLGDFLLSQSERGLSDVQQRRLAELLEFVSARGACHKVLSRDARKTTLADAPQALLGAGPPEEIVVRENGVLFALSFRAGCSVGLFLDQRENRRRFLLGHVASGFPLGRDREIEPPPNLPQEGSKPSDARERFSSSQVSKSANAPEQFTPWEGPGVGSSSPLAGMELLNTFAYTCGFAVCAAKAGARTTNLDLSKKYLEWGKRNFALNGLDVSGHDFIAGDVFDWLRRLAKKQRHFDLIALDPPTFSQSKEHGVFQAEKDFSELVASALPLLKPHGVLFASTNAARLAPEQFLRQIATAIGGARHRILQQHFAPQPADFPISRPEPAYLKTIWLRIA
jgi:23S rRNA (cytosine1962-C5)-methyltransferase